MPKENASLPDDLRPIRTHDDVAQHRRSGMLGVPRCGKKDESPYLARLPELRYDVSRGPQCELRPIGSGELREALRVVSIPLPQLGAGRGALDPFIVINRALRSATGPQTVDEHSILVRLAPWVVVDADNIDVALHHTLWFPIHSDEAIRSQSTNEGGAPGVEGREHLAITEPEIQAPRSPLHPSTLGSRAGPTRRAHRRQPGPPRTRQSRPVPSREGSPTPDNLAW